MAIENNEGFENCERCGAGFLGEKYPNGSSRYEEDPNICITCHFDEKIGPLLDKCRAKRAQWEQEKERINHEQ